MQDGDQVRVRLPDGYALFQDGGVETDPRLKSAMLRRYRLAYRGTVIATLHDYVRASPRGVTGNTAFGGFTHSLRTEYTVTDREIPYEQRRQLTGTREGIGNTARGAAQAHQGALKGIPG